VRLIWNVLALLVIAEGSTMAAKAGQPVPFSSVSIPRLWAVGDSAHYIVATSRNWTRYYSSPPKDSDFDSSAYVVASMGTRPNPGYRIRIARIEQDGERVEVTVEQLHPEPGGIYPQVLVNPIAVAQIRRRDLQPHPLLAFSFVDQDGRTLAETKVEL